MTYINNLYHSFKNLHTLIFLQVDCIRTSLSLATPTNHYINYSFHSLLLRIRRLPPSTNQILISLLCFPCGTHIIIMFQMNNRIVTGPCAILLLFYLTFNIIFNNKQQEPIQKTRLRSYIVPSFEWFRHQRLPAFTYHSYLLQTTYTSHHFCFRHHP